MKRGELYRVYKGTKNDSKNYRVYLVVSRQTFIKTNFSTVICVPVYTNYHGIPTEVRIGVNEGMKRDCTVCCDELYSIRRNMLTDYVGCLSDSKMEEVNAALRAALEL